MKRSAPLRRKARLIRRVKLRRHAVLRRQRRDYEDARTVVRERAEGLCEARVEPVCIGRGAHAHHVLLRSRGGPDTPENLLWVCPPCHGWIHDHPAQATARGLIRRGAA